MLLEKLFDCSIGNVAKLTDEGAIEEEGFADDLGKGVKAYGTGGRKGRTGAGDYWDHFIVIYWYPENIHIDFSSG